MARAYLDEIVAHHRERAAADPRDWRARADGPFSAHASFAGALSAGESVAVIAEVKRRSPSRGWLDADLDAGERAALYARAGAAAVSVLTDGPHFGGSLDDLASARAATDAPLLRKDFVVSENDVLDAADAGAAAVLLIVAALDDDELARFVALAARSGLDALVEAHDADEATRALAAGARVVGVNQRDLRTFEVSTERAAAVVSSLPRGVVAVLESGIATRADVERAGVAGADAVLVGEALVRAADPAALLGELASVERRARV
jgi:indole-3-glycerol phosphate synthase